MFVFMNTHLADIKVFDTSWTSLQRTARWLGELLEHSINNLGAIARRDDRYLLGFKNNKIVFVFIYELTMTTYVSMKYST